MTLAEALARGEGALDAMYAVCVFEYEKIMRKYGASERDISEGLAEYKVQLAEDKGRKLAEMRVALIAPDDAPSIALH